MKEATGELSTTVIAVVAIAAIATLFVTVLLPMLRGQIKARTMCATAVCGACDVTSKTASCQYQETDDSGAVSISTITCACQD